MLETRDIVSVATSLARARPREAPPGGGSGPHVARTCIRKMADSGDGVTSTSSGKDTRGTIADGPVTDPASSMKVNRVKLQSNLKSRAVPRAPRNVCANLTAVCHDCRICRRSQDGAEWDQNAHSTSPSTILSTSTVARPAETKTVDVRFHFLSRIYVGLFIFFFRSQCLPLFFPFLPLSVSVNLLAPHLYFFCLAQDSLESCDHMWLLCNIGHMALIDMLFIDDGRWLRACLPYPEYMDSICSCDWIPFGFFSLGYFFCLYIKSSKLNN